MGQGIATAPKRSDHASLLRQRYWSEKSIDAKVCGGAGRVVRVETQQTFVNGLLGLVTFGIYTP